MLAYVGPEAVAPIMSGIAAVAGFLLIFWRKVVLTCKKTFRFIFRIKVEEEPEEEEMIEKSDPAKAGE